MNNLEFAPKLSPESYARDLLKRLRFNTWPVDPYEVARRVGLKCKETDFNGVTKVAGALVRLPNKTPIILVNISIKYKSKRNFTVAHELGHYEIKGHNDNYLCHEKNIMTMSDNRQEQEANIFASELLLPEQVIKDLVGRVPIDWDPIIDISDRFGVSLTAAAIKYVKYSRDPCAFVVSENGKINWSKKSESLKFEIREGRLPDTTYAHDFFLNIAVPKGPQEVLATSWLVSSQKDEIIIEHSLFMQHLGIVLTLLWLPENDQTDLDEDF